MHLLGISLLLALSGITVPPDEILSLFDASPLEAHARLRWEALQGRDVGPAVDQLSSLRSENSFQGLRVPSRELLRGLQLQEQGLSFWLRNDYPEAVRLYQQAYRQLERASARTEALFCLYYLSEIAAEMEENEKFRKWNGRAISLLPEGRSPYLTGLLFESRAHALWYLDRLAESAHSFSRALENWERIHFRQGLLNCWFNLASLYAELALPRRAEECYRRAVQLIEPSTPGETLFRVYSRIGLFYHRDYRSAKALDFLQKAALFESFDPNGYLLTVAEIEQRLEPLEKLTSPTTAEGIERFLIQGRIALREKSRRRARRSFQKALRLAERSGLALYRRKAALLMGESLEEEGAFAEAAEVYAAAHLASKSASPDGSSIFSRKRLPLLDGWIRCLMELGRESEARAVIHTQAPSLHLPVPAGPLRTGPTTAVRKDSGPDLPPVFRRGAIERKPPPMKREGSFATVELWPDRDRIFLWIEQNGREQAFVVGASRPIRLLVQQISDPLYRTDRLLLPGPDRRLLAEFGKALFSTLEPHVAGEALLLIPHKELQALPFDLLPVDRKELAFERYSISYLPGIEFLKEPGRPIFEPPILIDPETLSPSRTNREREFLSAHFPGLRRVSRLSGSCRARWIHLASHYELDPNSWFSAFSGTRTEPRAFHPPWEETPACDLLSIAACDTANTLASPVPFGVAEDLLLSGARSLLLSRWKLDELSVEIYLDFFRYCKEGDPMDVALRKAKTLFRGRLLSRNGITVPGDHPWFWAGITYLGVPGRRLFAAAPASGSGSALIASLLLFTCIIGSLVRKLSS